MDAVLLAELLSGVGARACAALIISICLCIAVTAVINSEMIGGFVEAADVEGADVATG